MKNNYDLHANQLEINNRPSWQEYFMNIAELTASRSSCFKENRKVGAVIVKDNRIIATGYNGAPSGISTCIEKGECLRVSKDIQSGTELQMCYAVHAEENAIMQCAKYGISTNKADIYVTHYPCSMCMKSIMQAGIKKIYYKNGYPDEFSKELLSLNKNKIEVIQISNGISK